MKKVLITGSTHGLGRALAFQFHDNGYKVCIHGRDAVSLEALQICLDCDVIRGDINDKMTIETIADQDMDVFINNAAIYSRTNFIDMDDVEILDMIQTNFSSPTILLKKMYQKGVKTIVNINSIAGKYGGDSNEILYSATKSALGGLMKSLQIDAAKNNFNIKLIDIYLGAIKTAMLEHRSDYNSLMRCSDVASSIYDTVNSQSLITNLEIRKN